LASLGTLMDIVIKFIALSAIARFDDIYAASLRDNKIKAATGKKLLIEFKRHMLFNHDRGNSEVHEDDNFEKSDGHSNENQVEHETSKLRKQCGLRFMRYVHKTFRILYVCWGYYF